MYRERQQFTRLTQLISAHYWLQYAFERVNRTATDLEWNLYVSILIELHTSFGLLYYPNILLLLLSFLIFNLSFAVILHNFGLPFPPLIILLYFNVKYVPISFGFFQPRCILFVWQITLKQICCTTTKHFKSCKIVTDIFLLFYNF